MTQSTFDSKPRPIPRPSAEQLRDDLEHDQLEHDARCDLEQGDLEHDDLERPAETEQERAESQRAAQEWAAREAKRDASLSDEGRSDAAPEGAQPAFGTSYLAEGKTEAAWQRWRDVQSNFVDDPQKAVKEAHGLVGEIMDGIVRRFEGERRELEQRWSSGQQPSTEDLRRSLQRYRDFFGRLLANVGDAKG